VLVFGVTILIASTYTTLTTTKVDVAPRDLDPINSQLGRDLDLEKAAEVAKQAELGECWIWFKPISYIR